MFLPIYLQHFQANRCGNFDLIYAAGLYDYLSDKVAARLTEKLFSLLSPKGVLMVANVLPDICDAGFMEAFMDWFLIYRDYDALQAIPARLDHEQLTSRIYQEPNGVFAFLEIRRCG